MNDERIPCRLEISPDGALKIIPLREMKLRPGEWAMFSPSPPEMIVHRVWFGRRWWFATRAYARGLRDANLKIEEINDETWSPPEES